jgi:RimJ/RimL family protein N-acetyltransferase
LPIHFKTKRLNIKQANAEVESFEKGDFAVQILSILSVNVTQELPPYFQNLQTKSDAHNWFQKMVSESELLLVHSATSNELIGFVFLYSDDNASAHIGYLLKENAWGQGFASELLSGLIEHIKDNQLWTKLIAGVSPNNKASQHLLTKVGFEQDTASNDGIIFYHFSF